MSLFLALLLYRANFVILYLIFLRAFHLNRYLLGRFHSFLQSLTAFFSILKSVLIFYFSYYRHLGETEDLLYSLYKVSPTNLLIFIKKTSDKEIDLNNLINIICC